MQPSEDNPLFRAVWLLVASLSGAITAQIWQPWKDMGPGKVALTIFAGTTFGWYVFPVFFHNVSDQKIAGGLTYLMSSCWNLLLPAAIKWIERIIPRGDDSETKP